MLVEGLLPADDERLTIEPPPSRRYGRAERIARGHRVHRDPPGIPDVADVFTRYPDRYNSAAGVGHRPALEAGADGQDDEGDCEDGVADNEAEY